MKHVENYHLRAMTVSFEYRPLVTEFITCKSEEWMSVNLDHDGKPRNSLTNGRHSKETVSARKW